jgi:hypothetical protein
MAQHQGVAHATLADALWSPAEIREGEYGLELLMATTAVTKDNVDDPRLWGNVLATQ